MKKLFTLIVFAFFISISFAQTFPGYRSGNYTGVNGVFFNPANIADSRYRWDINLFSIHAGVANNNASFKLKNLRDAFGENADSVFTKANKTTNGAINFDVYGPSFMFNLNKKTSIAITSRVRAMANVVNIDGNYVGNIQNNIDESLPFTLNSNGKQKISVNGWTDVGVSLGRVLYNEGKHFLKGGITLKYLMGSGNAFANINSLKATVDKDGSDNVYISNASGGLNLGYAGIDFDNFEAEDILKFNGHGAGGDIGFVYEYRPDADKLTERYQNKYKLKLGIALLDVGAIKYKPKADQHGDYTINVSGIQQWHPDDFDGKSASEIKTYLDGSPYFTNNNANLTSYKVNLPTTLQLNGDYLVVKRFYLELAGQINLVKKTNPYNSFYNNAISFTPRYEGKRLGVYLPINYNNLSHFNAGISFRAGPIFFGSGSVITALFKSKQADFHFGINAGSLFKKPKHKKKKTEETPPVVLSRPVDSDNDGITDDQDKCPQTPGIAKYNGCPIPDTDNDGMNDEEDKCPDVYGVAKYDGCPIPDTDKDGINDEEDKCPLTLGVLKYNGCPIPDTDGDGVNDEADKCPTLAGTVANNGCPEIKEEVIKKMTYAAKKIYFVTAKYTLLSTSFPALNQVAKLLKENPDLHIEIEGHTDNVGKPESNHLLSEKRALAVKKYLVSKGVNENHISYTGYGQTKPVADNKTAAGRKQNRRVELKLGY